jgi:uncharacterized protein YjdB
MEARSTYLKEHSGNGQESDRRAAEAEEQAKKAEEQAKKAKEQAKKAKEQLKRAKKREKEAIEEAEKARVLAEKEKAAIRRRWKIRVTILGGSGIAIAAIMYAYFIGPGSAVREVVVNPERMTIRIGETRRISATAHDTGGDTVYEAWIEWKSSNDNVAIVDDGTVKAISKGVAHISASCDGYVARTEVIVEESPRCARVEILNEIPMLALGDRHQLRVELFDAKGVQLKNGDVNWKSANTEIASVNLEGQIVALKDGLTNIMATCDDGSANFNLKVFAPIVSRVEIGGETSLVVAEGETFSLSAGVLLSHGKYAKNRTVQWKSSNPNVAPVDKYGNVSARSAGSVTISAECEGKIDQVTLQVRAAVRRVTILSDVTQMYPNQLTELKVRVFDGSGNELRNRTVDWSVNNPRVATVDTKGKLTSKQVGYIVVTAECENKKDTHEISVVERPPPMVKKITANAGDNNVWILTFNQTGTLTSWIQRDAFGFASTNLNGSGSASSSQDKRFAWKIDAKGSMMGLVPIAIEFWVTRSGEVYMQTFLGLGTVGQVEFWE